MINTPYSRQKSNIKGPNEQLFVTLERETNQFLDWKQVISQKT